MTQSDSATILTVDNLDLIVDKIKIAVGPSTFDRLVTTYHPGSVKGLRSYYLHRWKAHPFAVDWAKFREEVDNSFRTNSLCFSENSILFIDYMIRLYDVRNFPGIERIIRNMNNPDSYHSALFEIFILTSLLARGMKVEILSESPIAGNRTPDFIVKTKAKSVYVECKSLNDRARQEDKIWNEIMSRAARMLRIKGAYCRIIINANRRVEGRDIEGILDFIEISISDNYTTPYLNKNDAVTVTIQSTNSEIWEPGEFGPPRKHHYAWCEFEQKLFDGAPYYRRLTMIEVTPYFDADEVDRIDALISRAHRQIPSNHPSVIYVQISNIKGHQVLDIADNSFNRVFGSLNKRPRINAVVLCARVIPLPMADPPISDYFSIIPSGMSNTDLPEDFEILGAQHMQFPTESGVVDVPDFALPKDEGTILLEFFLVGPLIKNRGNSVLYYCSNDGQSQIRVWCSFKNGFRVDVVSVNYGRRIFETENIDIEPQTNHKIAVGWNQQGVSVAIDGRLLTEAQEAVVGPVLPTATSGPIWEWGDFEC